MAPVVGSDNRLWLYGGLHNCAGCEIGLAMKKYTCGDYRQEMILAGLRRQLAQPDLELEEAQRLKEQIRQLESEMGMA